MIAEWLARDPDSEAGLRLLKDSRRRPEYRSVLNDATIQSLMDLFDATRASVRSVSPAETRQASDTFSRFYHHGAPFDRGALLALWEACARSPEREQECMAGLEATERRLGSLRSAPPVSSPSKPDAPDNLL